MGRRANYNLLILVGVIFLHVALILISAYIFGQREALGFILQETGLSFWGRIWYMLIYLELGLFWGIYAAWWLSQQYSWKKKSDPLPYMAKAGLMLCGYYIWLYSRRGLLFPNDFGWIRFLACGYLFFLTTLDAGLLIDWKKFEEDSEEDC
jgi:hypothetical protein